jgi:hypothetical protein
MPYGKLADNHLAVVNLRRESRLKQKQGGNPIVSNPNRRVGEEHTYCSSWEQ